MRHLWAICAVLLWAGTAGAQTYDMIGDSAGANVNITMVDDDVSIYSGDQSSVLYTASTGDTVVMFKAWLESGDSVSFGLYEFDLVGDTPTVVAFVDTAVFSSGNEWDSLSTKFGLTDGTTYAVAMGAIGTTHNLKSTSGTGDTLLMQLTNSGWVTFDSSNKDIYERVNICLFARVAQYGGAASQLVVGETKIGVVELAPPE